MKLDFSAKNVYNETTTSYGGTSMDCKQVQSLAETLKQNISTVIVGKEAVIDKVILSLLCGGHILLEDIPGTGKTTLAKALAKSIRCGFKRVQFTPDLLPSDLTGINFFNQKEGEFVFKEGSVFTNILLGDEINRATPRTQSSLLECMEEGQVSVDGVTYPLAKPFLVIATQNPIEIQGTFPLPEAQLDRFFVRLKMGYPDQDNEIRMLTGRVSRNPLEALTPVLTGEDIVAAQEAVRTVRVSAPVAGYIVRLAEATRSHDKVKLGVSPRGAIALMRAAQARAAMDGRDFVTPEDVKAVAADVWCHRLICRGYSLSQASEAPAEILEQHPNARHTLIHNDPVHAIVTLREDGTVHIRGMKSSYFCGVTMESLGLPLGDPDGRLITPDVLTASFKLDMRGLEHL